MKFQLPPSIASGHWTVLIWLGLLLTSERLATSAGYWSPVVSPAPGSVNLMLLLSDGTVMAANNPVGVAGCCEGNGWYRLTPDSLGNYANGTWAVRASMRDTRYAFGSVVLADGRVFVVGGEYGSGANSAEIYEPSIDTWTRLTVPPGLINTNPPSGGGNGGFSDANSILLPDGSVLIGPAHRISRQSVIYHPSNDNWSLGPQTSGEQGEASWVKLRDGSILTVVPDSTASERFIPSLNVWTNDALLPVLLYASLLPRYVGEIGPAFLLADGRAFFIGGTGHTALYTPSGSSMPGTWAGGPDIPNGLVSADAPGAMMVNGRVLCAMAPPPFLDIFGAHFPSPTSFFEYDPTAGPIGSFTQVPSPTGGMTDNIPSQSAAMLALPDGTILYSDEWWKLYVYHSDGSPLAEGKPAIAGLAWNADGSLHLTGTLFNGISQGAAFGDDAQMDSNYPIVRMTDFRGQVFYARTYNWSSTGVQTGMTPVTTECALPVALPPGLYSLVVVANGNSSDPFTFEAPVWVDFNAKLPLQIGSFDFPFHTLASGVSAVHAGGTIRIKSGVSSETMPISKPMSIAAFGGPATVGR